MHTRCARAQVKNVHTTAAPGHKFCWTFLPLPYVNTSAGIPALPHSIHRSLLPTTGFAIRISLPPSPLLAPNPPNTYPHPTPCPTPHRDSIKNQKFFSFEAFGDFLQQVAQRYTTPDGLETPPYTLLRRTADYQIRRYSEFLVAEAPLDGCGTDAGADVSSSGTSSGISSATGSGTGGDVGSSTGDNGTSPASPGIKAFRELAKYLFGGNSEGRKMRMTTPVLSSTEGTMQFVIGSSDAKVTLGARD